MNLIQSNIQTMSSREIAKLTGKRHDNVVRTVKHLEIDQILTPQSEELNQRGRSMTVYHLNKRDSLVLVARLSPEFTAAIVDRWQELEQKETDKRQALASRQTARLEAPFLTDAVKFQRGDDAKHYHYSNEFNLINRIVLGQTAKQYRKEHDVDDLTPIRDVLTPAEIACIEHLQRANTTMIEIGIPYDERKEKLNKLYVQRHASALLTEVQREY